MSSQSKGIFEDKQGCDTWHCNNFLIPGGTRIVHFVDVDRAITTGGRGGHTRVVGSAKNRHQSVKSPSRNRKIEFAYIFIRSWRFKKNFWSQ